jgi:hypothetical protein
MSSRSDRDLLGDILESLRRAGVYLADQSYEQFLEDTGASAGFLPARRYRRVLNGRQQTVYRERRASRR